MLRLAEATASRELLFRELVAILQQESRAQKIIIAETGDQKRLFPVYHARLCSERKHGTRRQTSGSAAEKRFG
jgi:hypothetical protein